MITIESLGLVENLDAVEYATIANSKINYSSIGYSQTTSLFNSRDGPEYSEISQCTVESSHRDATINGCLHKGQTASTESISTPGKFQSMFIFNQPNSLLHTW